MGVRMSIQFIPSFATLCVVQGLLVAAPWRRVRLARSNLVGLAAPLGMLGLGVGIVNATSAGADALTTLAAVATPLLAASVGILRGWRLRWLWPAAAVGLYVLAWRGGDTPLADAAAVLLIAGACLALAAAFASVAPARAIAVGIVLLVALDMVLVWANRQVEPASDALHAAVPPALALPGGAAIPLPALQDISFSRAMMGWLDFLAPALLGTLVAGFALRARLAVGLAVTGAALAWGLLLVLDVTSPIPATIPVLPGLALWLALERRPSLLPHLERPAARAERAES